MLQKLKQPKKNNKGSNQAERHKNSREKEAEKSHLQAAINIFNEKLSTDNVRKIDDDFHKRFAEGFKANPYGNQRQHSFLKAKTKLPALRATQIEYPAQKQRSRQSRGTIMYKESRTKKSQREHQELISLKENRDLISHGEHRKLR